MDINHLPDNINPPESPDKNPDNADDTRSQDQIPENKAHTRNSNALFINFWNHLFDFFMLFLAVFCGFMADNWREQLSEHQREKTYILSLAEDIKSDTLESGKIIDRLKSMHGGIDSVLVLLTSADVMENSNNVYRIWTRNLGLEVFVSNDRTIEQLKNNGELRLIRNKDVSDRIMKYDQALKKYSTQSNMMYNALTNMTYYSQLFDFINLNKYPDIPVPLTKEGRQNVNQAFSHLDLWNRALGGLISWLETVNEEGKGLLELVIQEYSLD